jgi:hypothetical protein
MLRFKSGTVLLLIVDAKFRDFARGELSFRDNRRVQLILINRHSTDSEIISTRDIADASVQE